MMSICFTWFPILWFGRTQVIPEYVVFYKEVGILLGGLSGWWHYLMEHICRNATNYFMYQWVGACLPPGGQIRVQGAPASQPSQCTAPKVAQLSNLKEMDYM